MCLRLDCQRRPHRRSFLDGLNIGFYFHMFCGKFCNPSSFHASRKTQHQFILQSLFRIGLSTLISLLILAASIADLQKTLMRIYTLIIIWMIWLWHWANNRLSTQQILLGRLRGMYWSTLSSVSVRMLRLNSTVKAILQYHFLFLEVWSWLLPSEVLHVDNTSWEKTYVSTQFFGVSIMLIGGTQM